ncbi:MAG: oligopeptide/dipeptide ABC transporter ATP-binding protein [Chloroflexota bacterium]
MSSPPLVEADQIVKHFPLRGHWLSRERPVVHALDGVSFSLQEGEILAIVGESGSGKTTLGRCLLHLIKPSSGSVRFAGQKLEDLPGAELRRLRTQMQIVFQNPFSSLSPRMRIQAILEEPLRTHHIPSAEWSARIANSLEQVGLSARHHLSRFPHELSGGQCQRVAIARALSLQPRLLVLDEPTSALDVSVQAQIINLLDDLRNAFGLAYVFISHDLGVVGHLSDRVGVMYLGKLVELGTTHDVMTAPRHPYTKALLAAIPGRREGSQTAPLEGSIPSPLDPPQGCRFHTRCPLVQAKCLSEEPEFRQLTATHQAACHFAD